MNKEQAARKELENFRTRSKPLEKDWRILKTKSKPSERDSEETGEIEKKGTTRGN